MIDSIKRAFTWHWHLLALGTATTFACVSGNPSVLLPLVAAAEIAYLGTLGLNPRFQRALKLAKGELKPAAPKENPQEQFQRLLEFLNPQDLSRFHQVQRRCIGMMDLRRRIDNENSTDSVVELREESLDRMLWLFLKLLHQKSGMERFLAATDARAIAQELHTAQEELTDSTERDGANQVESRLTSTIRERITTIESRLENINQAQQNLELVSAEISKTEQQITHLCEVGMTQKNSAELSSRIDSISSSMQTTESTFADTSLDSLLDDGTVPPLISGARATPPPIPHRQRVAE